VELQGLDLKAQVMGVKTHVMKTVKVKVRVMG